MSDTLKSVGPIKEMGSSIDRENDTIYDSDAIQMLERLKQSAPDSGTIDKSIELKESYIHKEGDSVELAKNQYCGKPIAFPFL